MSFHPIFIRNEEEVLKYWETSIKKALQEVQEAPEAMFYLEDMNVVIEKAERMLKLVECTNAFKKQFQFEETHLFEEEAKEIMVHIQKLKAYPFSVSKILLFIIILYCVERYQD